ncbi:hypothetical protein [Pinibacter soli]|uniref:Uncharacterized protein n=1 Tax=Pinibacter soli TaxID=3044211 RepID=A0ABT6RAQ2_9BACT|nr:hypothetical protein [Pinibacter soli]MDI3319485.1 hypothetical protein [Pinibacter soli]
MLHRESRKIVAAIIVTCLAFSVTYAQDLLDNIKDNSKLTKELKDVYRAFHINNIIVEQKELINIYQDAEETDLKELYTSSIKACDSLKQIHFYNDTLNSLVSKYLTSTIRSYNILQSKGINSVDYKKDFEKYKAETEKYMKYLYSTYSTNHFVNLTEDVYWKANDKNNYIKSKEYPGYGTLKTKDLKEALALLESIAKQTTDFQEYSIYQIELADQYEKNRKSLGDSASEIAVEKYKTILDQRKYSIYLFEVWLKWRTVTQQNVYGLSKTSEIPNRDYDRLREQVALTILHFIVDHPKDEMAINEFLLMATHDIVKRFGDYPYGNQNTVEYHDFFDEAK